MESVSERRVKRTAFHVPPLSRLWREAGSLILRCRNLCSVRWREDQAALLSCCRCPVSPSSRGMTQFNQRLRSQAVARTPGNSSVSAPTQSKAWRGFSRCPHSIISDAKTRCCSLLQGRPADVTARSNVHGASTVHAFSIDALCACWFRPESAVIALEAVDPSPVLLFAFELTAQELQCSFHRQSESPNPLPPFCSCALRRRGRGRPATSPQRGWKHSIPRVWTTKAPCRHQLLQWREPARQTAERNASNCGQMPPSAFVASPRRPRRAVATVDVDAWLNRPSGFRQCSNTIQLGFQGR